MNREIKFRCWNIERKEMVYNVDLYSGGSAFEGTEDNPYEFDKKTLGQYTGLKDKNGKEIYEGDILQFSDKWEWHRGKFAGGILAEQKDFDEIKSDHKKYPYERREIEVPSCYEWLLSSETQQYWEVIGNIHENPELLNN